MMLGERTRLAPTLKVAPWDPFDDPNTLGSPFSVCSPSANAGFLDSLSALHRYLPSNASDSLSDDPDMPSLVSCDQFRMFEFKVRRCARGRSHDWTECPYAHPGEKARRRDPRKYHYSGSACPDFRKGSCAKGDSCEFAHGVFECWLHPARYRTQPCKDGLGCHRRVCFFAHTPEQLRVLPGHSPRTHGHQGFFDSATSPPISPPMSPDSPQLRLSSVNELVASMRGFKLAKMQMSPPSWVGSPRGPLIRPDFFSLPSTPTRGPGPFDLWEHSLAEEPEMERVESGRDLRARMYAKLSKENSMGRVDPAGVSGPYVDWVSELVSEG
ncbi:zinc finger CCCH domain-containing protein 20-like isoform X2 [Argentina anserina]|uniref:zinc finger CCCH domain-containing protein 20-like isoform X2 n=1 Tax=Argentina anserina TaxID=57926 RepID=UPI0021768E55|nr:zinc finger CCCH domain-containing protein 20-like isoform X2 [Potentilla anserina]